MLSLRPAVLLLLFAAVAFAAPALADDYVRYLIPVTGKNVIGANGSIWTTEFTIHNPRDQEMTILVFSCTGIDIITPSCGNSVTLTPMVSRSIDVRALTPAVRAAASRVRIEIADPLAIIVSPPPPPFWALVSITNNETQQVTTITAHP